MSSQEVGPKAGQLQAVTKKIFSHGNDVPPDPVYVNAIEFSSMGMDVFMDAGIVSPEAVISAIGKKSSNAPASVDMLVKLRFGMSIETALRMQQRLTEMLQRAQAQAIANDQPASAEREK